ncbi:sensor histidine kinase [Peribacillus glennii]|uniref:histidine kinase n=1 Tax=Peribacillus glennii TaxID=2303991 RepID=A0A372L731_9BACI|nr:ATP-binding protein [Peribacillus glennii]RFU60978.1 sensor histidine kinase [Peribacillus glennii]
MKIRTKIQLYSSLFLLAMLLLLNVILAFLFFSFSLEREKEMLEDQAALLKESHSKNEIFGGGSSILTAYTPEDGTVFIVNLEGEVVNMNADDEDDAEVIPPRHVKEEEFDVREERLIYHLPYRADGELIGTIEIRTSLESVFEGLSLLATVLMVASLIILILSVVAGRWLSTLIIAPISIMSRTMSEIERDGTFKTIPVDAEDSKDELKAMAVTFNKMMDRLEINYAKQQQFLSDASHELKTPLTIIDSYASLLRRWGMKDKKILEEAVEAIQHEAQRMKTLTGHLLEAATQGHADETEKEELEAVQFCREVAQPLSRASNRTILINASQQEINMVADKTKLEQILIILLDNALKYSSDEIIVKLEQDDSIAIIVEDKGIGISQRDLAFIFDRFYRVDRSRSRKTGGNGLGLSIAKSMVEAIGAELEIKSVEGKGTSAAVIFDA